MRCFRLNVLVQDHKTHEVLQSECFGSRYLSAAEERRRGSISAAVEAEAEEEVAEAVCRRRPAMRDDIGSGGTAAAAVMPVEMESEETSAAEGQRRETGSAMSVEAAVADREAAVLHTHTATGVGVNGGGVVGGGFSVGVGEEESLLGVAASVGGRRDPERQGLGLGGRTAARGRSGERWAAVTMVGAGAAMLGRCDDGGEAWRFFAGEARGAMVVRTAEEERVNSMKNLPHGGEGAREREEEMREREEG
uniref:Uncharacterized protein n=1 Tax=Oryza nivara TaxID=4536 RepID=A0A0E0HJV2_ORYNI